MRAVSSYSAWTPSVVAAVILGLAAAGCARGTSEPSLRPQAQLNNRSGTWSDRNPNGYGLGSGVDRQHLNGNASGHGGNAFGHGSVGSSDTVYFQSDSSELTPESRATLGAQLSWLRGNPTRRLTIEGHADERGTREYNIALGAKRAEAVRSYFASQGMNGSLVRTVSYGKERPVATCDDISCWSKNRRAQVVLSQ
jgi:peptidoglycan-associated lipoprotein